MHPVSKEAGAAVQDGPMDPDGHSPGPSDAAHRGRPDGRRRRLRQAAKTGAGAVGERGRGAAPRPPPAQRLGAAPPVLAGGGRRVGDAGAVADAAVRRPPLQRRLGRHALRAAASDAAHAGRGRPKTAGGRDQEARQEDRAPTLAEQLRGRAAIHPRGPRRRRFAR